MPKLNAKEGKSGDDGDMKLQQQLIEAKQVFDIYIVKYLYMFRQ